MFTVAELAEHFEDVAYLDFARQPSAQFRTALELTLRSELARFTNYLELAELYAWHIKVELSHFDRLDPDWQRLVAAIAKCIFKLHVTIPDSAVLHHIKAVEVQYVR